MELIISLLSGAIGGNVAGKLLKNFDLGLIGNSLAGVLGGGLGGQILTMLGAGAVAGDPTAGGGIDIGTIVGNIASGGVGGGAVIAIIGVVRSMIGK